GKEMDRYSLGCGLSSSSATSVWVAESANRIARPWGAMVGTDTGIPSDLA
ncbi:hypothetical protein Tco_0483089, partial [Tanacetum coccineum]